MCDLKNEYMKSVNLNEVKSIYWIGAAYCGKIHGMRNI